MGKADTPEETHEMAVRQILGKLNPRREDRWTFGDKRTGAYLLRFSWFKIERHVLVQGTASPDDPGLRTYWKTREAAGAKDLVPKYQKVARSQGHVCSVCGETLYNEEESEQHHIEPRAVGGNDEHGNLTLMHLYCHQQVTRAINTRDPTRKWLRQWLA